MNNNNKIQKIASLNLSILPPFHNTLESKTITNMSSASTILSSIGVLTMLHAAYSCMHYRSMLQDLDLIQQQDDGSRSDYPIPPLDVYVEVAVSFAMILLSELIKVGPFQSVDISKNRKPLVAPAYITRDFDIYNNRSKVLLHKSS
jgi:hypothetical protein